MNVGDAAGLAFECRPSCGFCCTVSPLVGGHEAAPLGPRLVRLEDGTLRIPLASGACSALLPGRSCSVYADRPAVCRLYPYHVHAGRRVQVTVSLACPGVGSVGEPMEEGAARAGALALALPRAREMADRAKATFAEFDRRMAEWGVAAAPDRLRSAFLPHVASLAEPTALPSFLAGVEAGVLAPEARAVADLFGVEADDDLADLVEWAAGEAFAEPEVVAWVEPDLSWTRVERRGRVVRLRRERSREVPLDRLPLDLDDAARAVVEAYLARLLRRDRTEGTAAWLVDASGYQATPASAYARVLGEASLHVFLRAALLAADDGAEVVSELHARRGVGAYETAYHSLPTLGAIL